MSGAFFFLFSLLLGATLGRLLLLPQPVTVFLRDEAQPQPLPVPTLSALSLPRETSDALHHS